MIVQVSPAKPCTASSVSFVSPSWLIATSTSAAGASPSTTSSACTAGPAASAAWNEVPQPGKQHASPRGQALASTLSARSHAGWAAIASGGEAAGHECVYTMPRTMGAFEQHTLSNGIRVLTAPMPQAQSVSCMLMFAAGSRYETPENNGIAHFAEHMFFKGTERRPTAATSLARSTGSAAR